MKIKDGKEKIFLEFFDIKTKHLETIYKHFEVPGEVISASINEDKTVIGIIFLKNIFFNLF